MNGSHVNVGRIFRRFFKELILMAFVAGCVTASAPTYINPKYDFSVVKKIAVFPLENLTQDQQAGERVRKVVVSEFLAAGVLDVVEPAQVNRALNDQGVTSISNLSSKQLQQVGKSLGAQALILGSVDVYDRVNVGGGNFAEVAITLRALDADSGAVIWSVSKSAGGTGVVGRLFGFGGDTMFEATQKAVRGAVNTLFQ